MARPSSFCPPPARVSFVLALLWVCGLFVVLGPLPFFADDYSQLARTQSFASAAEAFDLEQKIYRPLETLLFYVMNQAGLDRPWIGRLDTFGMHVGVCVLLFLLARRLGASSRAASLGVLLFALAPNTRTLGWVVAHGTPSRALFVLAGLLLFQERKSRPFVAAIGTSLCLGIGLLFHTGAIVLPVLCASWVLIFDVRWSRSELRSLPKALASPALLAQLAVAVGYVLFTLQLPNRYHAVQGLGALPASFVRGSTFAFPEELRRFAVEGLRGEPGSLAFVLGAGLVLAVLGLLAALLWRGPRAARFLILAGAVDLLPYVVATGFSMRYAYLAFGFVALGWRSGWTPASDSHWSSCRSSASIGASTRCAMCKSSARAGASSRACCGRVARPASASGPSAGSPS